MSDYYFRWLVVNLNLSSYLDFGLSLSKLGSRGLNKWLDGLLSHYLGLDRGRADRSSLNLSLLDYRGLYNWLLGHLSQNRLELGLWDWNCRHLGQDCSRSHWGLTGC